jgi:hypothetical protein
MAKKAEAEIEVKVKDSGSKRLAAVKAGGSPWWYCHSWRSRCFDQKVRRPGKGR